MHILYLSPWFPYPPDTGSRTRVYHLLRALAQRMTSLKQRSLSLIINPLASRVLGAALLVLVWSSFLGWLAGGPGRPSCW